MANSASAKKRIKQNERDKVRNRARKSAIKTETRKFNDAIQQGELQVAKDALERTQKKIAKVAARGTLHANTAARQKSRLARTFNAAVQAAKGVAKD